MLWLMGPGADTRDADSNIIATRLTTLLPSHLLLPTTPFHDRLMGPGADTCDADINIIATRLTTLFSTLNDFPTIRCGAMCGGRG